MSKEYQRPPVRVALMGLGRAMFEDHYSIFKAHPGLFKVVAACDLLKERRDIIAQDFPDCRMYRQFSDMLDERDIDLVDIATCSQDHVAHALKSLERGFWTLLESPLALTYEDAAILRGAAMKAKNRLLVVQRGMFAPDFLLTKQVMGDPRLGEIFQLRILREDYVRRDDWQTVKRLGGGASYYAMTDLVMQALKLLTLPPIQMWSELKRIASLGDAEDYAHIVLKTRGVISADIEFNGGSLAENRGRTCWLWLSELACDGTCDLLAEEYEYDAVGIPHLSGRQDGTTVHVRRVSPGLSRVTTQGVDGLGPAMRLRIRASDYRGEQRVRRAGVTYTVASAEGHGRWVDLACKERGSDRG